LPQANGGRVPAFDEDQAPGAADFPDAAKEGEVLRKHADAAMYAAKAAGGNGYRFWLKPQARLES
jgi:GGDEF domain-containing protein